jgi:transposase-like protein/IS1 family transposase
VIAVVCQHENRKVHGKTKSGATRFKCKDCGKTFTASTELFAGMRIGLDRAAEIINLLCEGMAVRAVARITDTSKTTILELLNYVGERCEAYMSEHFRGLMVDDVQVDELWQYIYGKNATATARKIVGGVGDSYTYTAIERHTKLLICWEFGRRDASHAHAFCRKLATATTGRFHLSSDAYGVYEQAVTWNLGGRVDYGQVVKVFGSPSKQEQRRYSPARIIGSKRRAVLGHPDKDRICTSHCERMNGTIRHFTKRMARLTCAFSKRWDNHRAALALFFCHYNWCRKHRSLKGLTPAMAHGLSTEVWSVRQLLQTISNR